MRAQDKKKAVGAMEVFLEKGSKDHISRVARALAKLPKKERREIVDALEKSLFKKEKIGKVKITSAVALGETEKKKIEHAIGHKYNFSHVVTEEKVDKRVIAGVKVKVGDEVYDGTLRNKILKLNRALTA